MILLSRRLAAVGAAAVLLLSACGGAASPSPSAPSASASAPGSEPPASSGPPETLTIWTWKENHIPAIKAVADAWNAKTGGNVNVDVQFYTETDAVFQNKITAAARTNGLPDLLSYYGGAHWDLAGSGILTDLTSDVDADWLSQFPASIVDGGIKLSDGKAAACASNADCKYKDIKAGSVSALPQIAGATGYVFANKKLLQTAGVDVNRPPANWQEWIDAMTKTVAADPQKGGLGLGLKVPETGYLWVFRLLGFSHLGSDAFAARFNQGGQWTSPASEKTFRLYDQLSPLWLPTALQTDIGAAESAFGRGDSAWLIGGTFSYSTLIQTGIDPNDVMVFPVPTDASDVIKTRTLKPWVSVMLGVTKDAKNRQLALDFMRFYFSQEGAAIFGTTAQDLPAIALPPGSVNAGPLAATQEAFSDSPDAFDEFTTYGPQCDAAKTVTNQASVALTRLITKESDPAQVAQEFQTIFDTAWKACGI
jgi:ABC-type glycerol-3-phosphate transport system substrate-binding protein